MPCSTSVEEGDRGGVITENEKDGDLVQGVVGPCGAFAEGIRGQRLETLHHLAVDESKWTSLLRIERKRFTPSSNVALTLNRVQTAPLGIPGTRAPDSTTGSPDAAMRLGVGTLSGRPRTENEMESV